MLASPLRSVRRLLAAFAPASRPVGRHRDRQKRLTLHGSGIGTTAAAITVVSVLTIGGLAQADTITDNIVDTGTGVTLTAGSSTTGTANIMLNNVNSNGGDTVNGCNVAGSASLVLNVVAPTGVVVNTGDAANPSRLTITACGTAYPVTFRATSTAVSGHAGVTIVSQPAGTFQNQVDIPITITQPAPTNTAPSVAVTGVTATSYEIGSGPAAKCAVTDAEDGNSTIDAVLSGTLTHGLGSQTATCDYTDKGGLKAPTKSVTYTIVDT